MRDAAPAIHLKDYTPPAFLVSTIALDVDIRSGQVTVRSTLRLARNPARGTPGAPLVLDGDGLTLASLKLDGKVLAADEYTATPDCFTLRAPARQLTLDIETIVDPGAQKTPGTNGGTTYDPGKYESPAQGPPDTGGNPPGQ